MAINTQALRAALTLLEAVPGNAEITVGTPHMIKVPNTDWSGCLIQEQHQPLTDPWRKENKRKGTSQNKRRKMARRK